MTTNNTNFPSAEEALKRAKSKYRTDLLTEIEYAINCGETRFYYVWEKWNKIPKEIQNELTQQGYYYVNNYIYFYNPYEENLNV